ncbi:MAG: ferritin-like domain-containing protein [Acidobacteriota bacterium]
MATQETQLLDDILVRSRRKMLSLGGAALAGLMLADAKPAQAATTYTDADILNFALNLEYLEANFYYLAAFGCTIDKPNAAAIAAGAPSAGIPITGSVGTAGTVTVSGTTKVPFGTDYATAAYANETAIEEGKHVLFLQTALGSSTYVAQPAINLDAAAGGAWPTLATAAGVAGGSGFSPYTSNLNFLLGAYVFEDVGVTAYHGAASLLTNGGNLSAAGGILAVEAYHAGLVRTAIFAQDPSSTSIGAIAGQISALRSALALAASPVTLTGTAATLPTLDPNPDDFGTAVFPVTLAGVTSYMGARVVDSDTTDTTNPIPLAIAFARNTTQVLNIVTGGGAISGKTVVSPAKGVFFPNGLNAGPNGFK